MLGKRQTSLVLILQTAMLLVLLVMLWRPALVVTTAAPRQNIAAVLIDDSASMNLEQPSRLDRVKKSFGSQSPIVKRLGGSRQEGDHLQHLLRTLANLCLHGRRVRHVLARSH